MTRRVTIESILENDINRASVKHVLLSDSAKCREYAARPTPFPPIQFINGGPLLWEGRHRVAAAWLRGDAEIEVEP